MTEVSLAVDATRPTGSAAARRLRAAGKVPAVLYGHGVEPRAVAIDRRSLRAALAGEAGVNTLLSLDVAGTKHLALVRQMQRDPVRNTVDHVDLVIVNRDEVVSAEVPLHLVGEAIEVHRADGLVEQLHFSVLVHARPADIPAALEFDVSGLKVGDTVRVGDLPVPEGVRPELDDEEPLIVVQASRLAAEVAEGAGAAEGDSGAEAGEEHGATAEGDGAQEG